jgi:hypothetical protein
MRTKPWLWAALCFGAGCESEADPVPTFERDIVPIFERSCGSGVADCHRREAYSASVNQDCRGWLSLEDAPLGSVFNGGGLAGQPTGCPDLGLWDRLHMNGWMCGAPTDPDEPQIAYVVPCDPESSLLYRSMVGPLCSNMATLMPKGQNPDPDEVETIYSWIENGAPRLDDPGPVCDP